MHVLLVLCLVVIIIIVVIITVFGVVDKQSLVESAMFVGDIYPPVMQQQKPHSELTYLQHDDRVVIYEAMFNNVHYCVVKPHGKVVELDTDDHVIFDVNNNNSPLSDIGDTTLVFYCHGNANSLQNTWINVAEQVAHITQSTVVVHDYENFGMSSSRSKNHDKSKCERVVSDARELLLHVLHNNSSVKKLVLYGRSIGGGVVLQVAESLPANIPLTLILETPYISLRMLKTVGNLLHRLLRGKDYAFDCEESLTKLSRRRNVNIVAFIAENDEIFNHDMTLHLLSPHCDKLFSIDGATHNDVMSHDVWRNEMSLLKH
jgi:pimeloyl-ACP methyl ester carboxylesterase